MKRKIIAIFFTFLLAASILPSCSKEAEDGTIESIELESNEIQEGQESSMGIFTKLYSPHEYDYKSFSIKKAHMKLDVPGSWNSEFVNSRYALFRTPSDDSFLPGVSISLFTIYGENVETNEMSEITENNLAFRFPNFFKNELVGMPCYVGGKYYHMRKYVAEDILDNGLPFVDTDHQIDAATLVSYNVALVDKAYNPYTGCALVATYFKWDHSPFCMFSVVPEAMADNARAMIEYMVSSITYANSDSEGFHEVSYEDFTTSVPTSFAPLEGAENIFHSSLYENTETSGMAVGVFSFDEEAKKTVTAENIASHYGNTIADLVYGRYDLNPAYGVQARETEGAADYSGTLSINCSGHSDATEVAGSVFGIYSYYNADYYLADKGDKLYLIAVTYQDCQKEIAEKVGEMALKNLRIN